EDVPPGGESELDRVARPRDQLGAPPRLLASEPALCRGFGGGGIGHVGHAASADVQARQRRALSGTDSRHSGHCLLVGAAGASGLLSAPISFTTTMKSTRATNRKSTIEPSMCPSWILSGVTVYWRQSPPGSTEP